jgi:formate/nitrite transporter FocA (FNT family)
MTSDRQKLIGRVSAIAAIINLGFEHVLKDSATTIDSTCTGSAEFDVVNLASGCIEDERTEAWFCEEAAHYESVICDMDDASLRDYFKHNTTILKALEHKE